MHSTCRIESLNWREPNNCESAHYLYGHAKHGLQSDPAELSHKAVAFNFSSPNPAGRPSLGFLQPLAMNGYSSYPPASTTSQDARTGFSYPWVGSGPLAVVGAHVGAQDQNAFYCHHCGTRLLRKWKLEPQTRMPDLNGPQRARRAGR